MRTVPAQPRASWNGNARSKHRTAPGASDEERKEAVKQFGFIGQLPGARAMWRALDDLIAGSDDATGRLILETRTKETGTVRWLRVLGHKDIVEKLTNLPIIYADATLPLDLCALSARSQARLRSRRRGAAHAGHPGDRAAGRQVVAGA